MTEHKCLKVGLKLLGAYFAVLAVYTFTTLLYVALSQRTAPGVIRVGGDFMQRAASFPQAAVQIAAAFVLTQKTQWCLRKINAFSSPLPRKRRRKGVVPAAVSRL